MEKKDPGWMTVHKIPTRKCEDIGWREIGFHVDIHIERIELAMPVGLEWKRYIWQPQEHKPTSILIWGWFQDNKGLIYPASFCVDREGPQLPNVSYSQACWTLHQNYNFTSMKGYNKIKAAITRICSVVDLNALYTVYSSWPAEIKKAVPQKLLDQRYRMSIGHRTETVLGELWYSDSKAWRKYGEYVE